MIKKIRDIILIVILIGSLIGAVFICPLISVWTDDVLYDKLGVTLAVTVILSIVMIAVAKQYDKEQIKRKYFADQKLRQNARRSS